MCKGFRSKKAPENGDRTVHGSGTWVSLGLEAVARVAEGRERKKESEK